jgi:hypothetical protein
MPRRLPSRLCWCIGVLGCWGVKVLPCWCVHVGNEWCVSELIISIRVQSVRPSDEQMEFPLN